MSQNKGLKPTLLFVFILLIPLVCYFLLRTGTNHYRGLQYYGTDGLRQHLPEDSAFHTVGNFKLRGVDSQLHSQSDLNDKLYVALFLRAKMNAEAETLAVNMASIAQKYQNLEKIRFVTFIAADSLQQLQAFETLTDRYYPEKKNWLRLYGDERELMELAAKKYLIPIDSSAENAPISSTFTLVDSRKHIRAFHEGTEYFSVDTLKDRIMVLMKEEINLDAEQR